jgi:hypothetical protein
MGDFDNQNFLFIEGVFIKDIIIKKRFRKSGYKTKKTIEKLEQKLVIVRPKCDNCLKKNQNEKFSVIYGVENYNSLDKTVLIKSTEKFCSNSCVKKYIKSKYDYSKSFNLLSLLDYQRKSIDI